MVAISTLICLSRRSRRILVAHLIVCPAWPIDEGLYNQSNIKIRNKFTVNWRLSDVQRDSESGGAKQVYRVITDVRDHRGNWKLDPGPWLVSQNEAEFWADYLRTLGYAARVEKLEGHVSAHQAR